MNIYDIAKLSGVSIATVSRVLNNKPGVSIEARNCVMSIVEKNNFIPNQLAKSLANKKTYVVGIVMPGINHYFSHRVDAINRVLKEAGYSLMITANYRDYNSIDDDIQNFNLLIEKRVDGIIYFPTHVSEKHVELLKRIEKKIPIVVTDAKLVDINISSVTQDSYKSTCELLTYFTASGHEDICFINGLSYDKVNEGRYQAYKDTLMKNNRILDENYIENGNYSLESGYTSMNRLFDKMDRHIIHKMTAVFAANDNMAIGAIKAIQERGFNVPEDISVIGYDGIEYGQYFNPSLTTVRINQYLMGEKAAEMVLKVIESQNSFRGETVMDYEIIYGGSSK